MKRWGIIRERCIKIVIPQRLPEILIDGRILLVVANQRGLTPLVMPLWFYLVRRICGAILVGCC